MGPWLGVDPVLRGPLLPGLLIRQKYARLGQWRINQLFISFHPSVAGGERKKGERAGRGNPRQMNRLDEC